MDFSFPSLRRNRRFGLALLVTLSVSMVLSMQAAAVAGVRSVAPPQVTVPSVWTSSLGQLVGQSLADLEDPERPNAAEAARAAKELGVRVEDVSKRDARTWVFAKPNGSWLAEQASEPVRALDEDGVWRDLDLGLVTDAGALRPKVSDAHVRFSDGGDRVFAAMTVAGHEIEWRWPTALPTPTAKGSSATYADVVPGGDLVVTAVPGGLTHVLVLRERPTGPVEVPVEVSAPGLTVSITQSGSLEFRNAAGRFVLGAPAPLMWDSSSTGDDVDPQVRPVPMSLTPAGEDGVTTLRLEPDAGFLADPATVFPVTVDPSLTQYSKGDSWVEKGGSYTSSQSSSAELRVGTQDSGTHVARAYVNFGNSTWSGKQVLSAKLQMRNFYSASCTTGNINVARLSESWSGTSLSWSNQPSFYASTAVMYAPAHGASGCPAGWAEWNLLDIVKTWAANADTNLGLRVYANTETWNGSFRRYRSVNYQVSPSYRPRLLVTYNTAPGTPTSLAIDPCDPCTNSRVTASFTPTLKAKSTDADGNQLSYVFQVAPSNSTTPLASSPSVGPLNSGTTASWQVPAGVLADEGAYRFRVQSDDGNTTSAWSGWLSFSVGADQPPAEPSDLALSPCGDPCQLTDETLVSRSLNPVLSALVTDPDSDTVEATFDLRETPSQSDPNPAVTALGSDVVTSGERAEIDVPLKLLNDGGDYQFRASATNTSDAQPVRSTWQRFVVKVDPDAPPNLHLDEPLVVFDTGPRLTWTPYADPSTDAGDDLVEYQIFRRPSVSGPDFPQMGESLPYDMQLAGTVTPEQLAFTDTTAMASTAETTASYYYWVAARTADDVAHNKPAQTATNSWLVVTPRTGRVRRILTASSPPGPSAASDTTISKAQPDSVLGSPAAPDGQAGAWLQAGTGHAGYGTERALLWFNLSDLTDATTITDAHLDLHQNSGQGTGAGSATFSLHRLTAPFIADQATWNRASSTADWTDGGAFATTALAQLTASNAEQALSFGGESLRSLVQQWKTTGDMLGTSAPNQGLLLKAADESATAPQQWLNISSAEASSAPQRPKLVVEQLRTPLEKTFVGQFPQRFVPGGMVRVPVTVTNTTAASWPADLALSYRWSAESTTSDLYTSQTDRYQALERSLAPGESVQILLPLRTPIQSDSGNQLPAYDLVVDLFDPPAVAGEEGEWWSIDNPYTKHVPTETERENGACLMVASDPTGGLLCPRRVVKSSPSSMIGLEDWFSFTGVPTGAGSSLLANLYTGNLSWTYDAFANPTVGPGAFARVTYNRMDSSGQATGGDTSGVGWSVQVSALNRLGSVLSLSANSDTATLVDGDGTTHVWSKAGTTYERPPGVHLDFAAVGGTEVDRKWVFTRPDGLRFYYGTDAQVAGPSTDFVATSVVDSNGNKLSFGYAAGHLSTVTDAMGRTVATLTWTPGGKIRTICDVVTTDSAGAQHCRALRFTYTDDTNSGLLSTLEDGDYNPATSSYYSTAASSYKKFQFDYVDNSSWLSSVTDPRGHASQISYYDANVNYATGDDQMPGNSVAGWVQQITGRADDEAGIPGQQSVVRYFDGDPEGTGSNDRSLNARVIARDSVADPKAATTGYHLDGFGRTVWIRDAEQWALHGNDDGVDGAHLLTWDADHNVVALTEPTGATWRWRYNPATGFPEEIWDAEAVADGTDGQQLSYAALDAVPGAATLASTTTPAGHETTFGRDAAGNLLSVTDPLGHVTGYTYDAHGLMTSTTDPRSTATTPIITTFAYPAEDNLGFPSEITPPATGDENTTQAPTTFAYDGRGNVTATRQTGAGTTLATDATYDIFGRPVQLTTPGSQSGARTTTTSYDANDNVLTVIAPNGAATTSTYAAGDQLLTRQLPWNGPEPTSEQTPRTQVYAYDTRGRLAQVTSPAGTATTQTDDHTVTYAYDLLDRVTSTTVPLAGPGGTPAVTHYAYDAIGQLLSVTDPRGNTTKAQYDQAGRPVLATDAAGYNTRTTYDRDGQVTAVTDARGVTRHYTYDEAGQLIAQRVPYTPIGQKTENWRTTFDYDAAGNLTTVVRPYTTTADDPDAAPANNALSEHTTYDIYSQPITREGAYDAANDEARYRQPSVTQFDYDVLGRLTRQSLPKRAPTAPADDEWTTYTYYDSGQIHTSTDPWGIATAYEYDKLGAQTKRTLTPAPDGQADTTPAPRVMTWAYYPDGSLASRDDQPGPAPVLLIDNTNAPVASFTGTWANVGSLSETASTAVGNNYRTHAAATSSTDTATWKITPGSTGDYLLEASCPVKADGTTPAATSTSSKYTITRPQGSTSTTNNQTVNQATCTAAQPWRSLGTFRFTGGRTATVKLAPNSGGTVVADAVRLVSTDTSHDFSYRYDLDGRQVRAEDGTASAKTQTYQTDYDAVGRPMTVLELGAPPSAGAAPTQLRSTDYTYDAASNVRTVHSTRAAVAAEDDTGNVASGTWTNYCYDSRNLVATITTGPQPPQTSTAKLHRWAYTYTPTGQVATWTKPSASDSYTAEEATGCGTTAKLPTGNETDYSYFEAGLLRSSTENTHPATGDPALVAFHQLSYNSDGDRTRDIARVMNAADGAGTVEGIPAFLDQTAAYRYTPARQLAAVTKSGASKSKNETYRYDEAGNTDLQTVDGIETAYHFERNRLTDATIDDVAYTYTYDPFGRQTETRRADGSTVMSSRYDGFDRLTSQTIGEGTDTAVTSTGYDVLDRAVLRTVTRTGKPETTTRYSYLGLSEQVAVEERLGSNDVWQPAKTYYYTPSGRPLLLENTPVATDANPDPPAAKTHLYGYNPHGDTETLTNLTDGTTTATYRYTAFGLADKEGTKGADDPADDAGTGADADPEDQVNPYRYGAKRFDAITSEYDMGFRSYDPGLNRFLTRDSYNGALDDLALGSDPWNSNRYAFAGGNPISRVELDGHRAYDESTGMEVPQQESVDAANRDNTYAEVRQALATIVPQFSGDTSSRGNTGGLRGVGKGFLHGATSTVTGLAATGRDLWLGGNPFVSDEASEGAMARARARGDALKHPVRTFQLLVQDCASRGSAECSGEVLFDALTLGFSGTKVAKLGRLSELRAAKGGDDLVDVWRTVGADEAADIAKTGGYRVPAGGEGKYFFPTREQAENLGRMYSKKSWAGPQTLTRGQVPRSVIERSESLEPAGEGLAWFIRSGDVPSICNVVCIGPIG